MYYVWFKPIQGLHGLEMTFSMELSLLPLLYMEIVSQWKGRPIFLFTLPCFGSLSFFYMACNFKMYVGLTSNGLSIINEAYICAWCWAFASFTNRWGSLINMWKVQGLGGSIIFSNAVSTISYMQYSTAMMSSPSII